MLKRNDKALKGHGGTLNTQVQEASLKRFHIITNGPLLWGMLKTQEAVHGGAGWGEVHGESVYLTLNCYESKTTYIYMGKLLTTTKNLC